MTGNELTIEPTGAKDLGPCACCSNATRRVWGFAHRGDTPEAAYFVEWVAGAVLRHGANFDLILGAWGDGTTASDRAPWPSSTRSGFKTTALVSFKCLQPNHRLQLTGLRGARPPMRPRLPYGPL